MKFVKINKVKKINANDPLLGKTLYLKTDKIVGKQKFNELNVDESFIAKVSLNGTKRFFWNKAEKRMIYTLTVNVLLVND